MHEPPPIDLAGRPSGVMPDGSTGHYSPPPNPDDAPTVITRAGEAALPVATIAGRRIGPFEIIAPVGAGGMAAVLRAKDLELGRIVALKLLPPDSDAVTVIRFKQEARAAARLDHEGIARVFASGEDRGQHYIAFEFVEGKTLRQLIDEQGTIPPAACVRYLLDVAAGLAHSAERGVVHRDVKPSNVIITPAGQAKLVDMGLARHTDAASVNGGVTRSGTTLGTFDYLSPEQAMDPRRADVRSDIYSLGCTAYHALTGRPPVPDGTAAKKLHAHQYVPPLDPRVLNPAIPDELAVVLSRMLAKDPAQRYQTPGELIAHLAVVAGRLDVSVSGVSVTGASLTPLLAEPPRASLGWLAGIGAVAAALFVWLGSDGRPNGATQPPWEIARSVKPVDSPIGPAVAAAGYVVTPDGFRVAATAADLVRLLQDDTPRIRLEAGKEYDLSFAAVGIAFTGPELTLDASPGDKAPVLRLAASAVGGQLRPGSLVVRGAKKFRMAGIQVELVGSSVEDDVPSEVAGLWTDAESVEVVGCRWESDGTVWSSKSAMMTIARESPGSLKLSHVLFGTGAVAIRLSGPVSVDASECGFGPHDAAFDISHVDRDSRARASIALRHCTFLFKPSGGSVVEVDSPSDVVVTAGFCLFAAAGPGPTLMPGMTTGDTPPVLVRCDGAKPAESVFTARPGETNAYFRVEPYYDGLNAISWDRAREQGHPGVADTTGIRLASAPWADPAPLATVQSPIGAWAAFRVRIEQLSAIRVSGDPVVIGLREQPRVPDAASGPRRIYAGVWPPPVRRVADFSTERVKIWWPKPQPSDELPPNASPNLAMLIATAKPDDEIQVHHDGDLPFPPLPLIRPGLTLTIRAYPGCVPVLKPDPNSRLLDTTLFQIAEGSFVLDGLHFHVSNRVDPAGDPKPRAAVRVAGSAGVTLRNCVITLSEDDDRTAAVTIGGMEEMRNDPAERAGPGPQVRFENVLIRGRGRGVWVSPGRTFGLEMTNVLTAVDGPVVLLEPSARDLPASARGRISLARVTAALGGPFVETTGGKGGTAVPVDVSSDRCVFAPVGPARPMIRIAGGDTTGPEKYLTWQSDGPNVYANFDRTATVLEIRPDDETGQPLNWDSVDWVRFTREFGKSIVRVRFAAWPEGSHSLFAISPSDLRLVEVSDPDLTPAKPGSIGADTDAVAKPRGN